MKELTFNECQSHWVFGFKYVKSIEEGYNSSGLEEVAGLFKDIGIIELCELLELSGNGNLPINGTPWAVIIRKINQLQEAGIIHRKDEI